MSETSGAYDLTKRTFEKEQRRTNKKSEADKKEENRLGTGITHRIWPAAARAAHNRSDQINTYFPLSFLLLLPEGKPAGPKHRRLYLSGPVYPC